MFLGIDIGTTNISFIILDLKSNVVYQNTYPNDYKIHKNLQDAEGIYKFCESIVLNLYEKYYFSSIGISNQMHGVLYVDSVGNAVSALYTWQDERGNESYKNSTYANYLSCESGYKVASGFGSVSFYYDFVNNNIPNDAKKICTIGDYVAMKFAGLSLPVLNETNAAAIGLYDIVNHCWDLNAINKIGLDASMFPEVSSSVDKIGISSLGFNVYTAIGDNQASVYGVTENSDYVVLNFGTGSQVTFIVDKIDEIPNGCEVRPYFDDKYIIIGSALCGGYSYHILKNFFEKVALAVGGKFSYEIMNQWALDSDDDLVVDTKFKGTRNEPHLRGSISNISDLNFTPEALTKGFLNGMCDELLVYFNSINKVTLNKKFLVGSGNGVRLNKALRHIIASKFNMNLKIPAQTEEAAYGVSILIAKKETKGCFKKNIHYKGDGEND